MSALARGAMVVEDVDDMSDGQFVGERGKVNGLLRSSGEQHGEVLWEDSQCGRKRSKGRGKREALANGRHGGDLDDEPAVRGGRR